MKRTHIVGGGPRTGTTLLAEMMIACFDIDLHSDHEDSIYTLPERDGYPFWCPSLRLPATTTYPLRIAAPPRMPLPSGGIGVHARNGLA